MTDKKYKFPFIPKKYYPAVMFACKMMREGAGRNIAVKRAAKYYDVDEDAVSHHLAMRAGAGHQGKTPAKAKYVIYADHRFYGFHMMPSSKFDKASRDNGHLLICEEIEGDEEEAFARLKYLSEKYDHIEQYQEAVQKGIENGS